MIASLHFFLDAEGAARFQASPSVKSLSELYKRNDV